MMRDDWVEVELGSAFPVKYGKGLPTKVLLDSGFPVFGANGIIGYYSEYKYEDEQVLISCRGAASGAINISPKKCFVTNNSLIVEIPEELNVERKFLFYALKSANKSKIITGSAQPQVTINNANTLKIPLAPLPEQRAIVAKIEKLLSELDNGIANFKTAKAKLEIFRQAVLKKAFEGELTKVKVTPRPISDFANLVTKGASPKWQGFNYINDDTKLLFVTSENIRDGFIDLKKKKYLPFEFNEIQKRSILKNGDVLFNLVGASIGRSAIFGFDILANINQAVSIIRLNNDLYNKYLNYFLNSEIAKQEYLRKIVDVARANLSLKDVNGILIPYCPLNEQHAIVAAIESRLSICDKMTEIIDQSLEKAEALRQSILKKAFEGKLLSDDELAACRREADWEPAQKLLERIREDKAGGGKKARAGKRRGT